MPVGISEKLHFPTCSCDWDLEYLAECKVTNRGTSHHCRQSPNLFQIQQAWLVICSLGIVSTLQTIFMIGRRPGLLKLNFRRYLQRGGDCRKKIQQNWNFMTIQMVAVVICSMKFNIHSLVIVGKSLFCQASLPYPTSATFNCFQRILQQLFSTLKFCLEKLFCGVISRVK